MPLLTCKDLSVGYDSKVLVGNLNFSVMEGNYICIVGENGAGKSTLLKTILGLIKAKSGEIILKDGMTQQQIGYLPQQTHVQKDFPASVEEIVLSGFSGKMGFNSFYSKEDKNLADVNMEKMNIYDLKKSSFRKLSGGQQQRVLLARALCATEKLIVLDEPTAGVDFQTTHSLYKIINDLNKNEGISILMITHDIDVALKYASHILHVGKEAFYGKKEDYLNTDFFKKSYLEKDGGS